MIRILSGLAALLVLGACSSDYNSQGKIHEALEDKYTAQHMDAAAAFRGDTDDAAAERVKIKATPGTLIGESILIDDVGALWDGRFEVMWSLNFEDHTDAPQVRIPVENGLDPWRTWSIDEIDDSVGPSDLVYVTEYLPIGFCGGQLWMVQLRLHERQRIVELHLHVKDQTAMALNMDLAPRSDFLVNDSRPNHTFDLRNPEGPLELPLYAFLACQREESLRSQKGRCVERSHFGGF